MKKSLLLIALASLPGVGKAQHGYAPPPVITQPNVSFSAMNLVPLNFTYSNINQLLNIKGLDVPLASGAIRLDLCTNSLGWNVFASLSYDSGPGQAPANWMKKIFISKSSPDAQNVAMNTTLSAANQLLFSQPSAGTYSFYYNLCLNPVTTFVTPGQYHYTIHYTMTRP